MIGRPWTCSLTIRQPYGSHFHESAMKHKRVFPGMHPLLAFLVRCHKSMLSSDPAESLTLTGLNTKAKKLRGWQGASKKYGPLFAALLKVAPTYPRGIYFEKPGLPNNTLEKVCIWTRG